MKTKTTALIGAAALLLTLVALPGNAAADPLPRLPTRCQPPPPNPGGFVDCEAGTTLDFALRTVWGVCHTVWPDYC